jgi:carboxyvinyl-carboxyphosphonate phosphorylmutase
MSWTDRRQRFRALLASSKCFHPASVYDPISARVAEELEFEIAMVAGSTAAYSILGSPDIVQITLTELCEQVRRVSRACTLPLLVDADHGFGNALSVQRAIWELETVGAAAITIEDTALPAPYGAGGQFSLISLEEGASKMRAAVAARTDPKLVIIARTVVNRGLDDALARLRAYEKTGVDAVFLAGVTRREELEAVSSAISLPITIGPPSEALMNRELLAQWRVRICLQAHGAMLSGYRAYFEALKALRGGTMPSRLPAVASGDLIARLTRAADYERDAKDYLGG